MESSDPSKSSPKKVVSANIRRAETHEEAAATEEVDNEKNVCSGWAK